VHGEPQHEAVAHALHELPPRDDRGAFRVVVESPCGSRVKLKYQPQLGAFELSRPLVLGVAYPFDWGFIPGTSAPDGDPLDAMVVLDTPTYPGVVIACRALAMLRIDQKAKQGGGRQRNDRIIAEPVEARRPTGALSERVRKELESFFISATLFEDKDVRIVGWGSAEEAEALVDRSQPGR
jgi:inorganic pyrophosphatase